MNKIILSAAAGIAVGYFIRKIQDKADLQEMYDEIHELGDKAGKKIKRTIDKGIDHAEHLKGTIEKELK